MYVWPGLWQAICRDKNWLLSANQMPRLSRSNPALVDGWLWSRWGFTMFPATPQGIDEWIGQMGPGAGYAGLSATQKTQVRALVRQAVGPTEQWGPTVMPNAPLGSP